MEKIKTIFTILSEKLLVAAGRKISTDSLKLENAGIKTGKRGEILVNDYLQTSKKHIFAVGVGLDIEGAGGE